MVSKSGDGLEMVIYLLGCGFQVLDCDGLSMEGRWSSCWLEYVPCVAWQWMQWMSQLRSGG